MADNKENTLQEWARLIQMNGERYSEKDIERGREIARINALSRDECPTCGEPLEHFSGLEGIPAHRYCPRCMDVGYDDDGNQILCYA